MAVIPYILRSQSTMIPSTSDDEKSMVEVVVLASVRGAHQMTSIFPVDLELALTAQSEVQTSAHHRVQLPELPEDRMMPCVFQNVLEGVYCTLRPHIELVLH
eukprot:TRINITY_DN58704_c0_g1_i1.p4 TRINITY_DN58704_c0_g1~~TRINITY_DN58704_c0_g1_i1.p4  ORF type:complete len:102 (-),score=1.29 TRINITY_DN58704_c0_g1_i1:141-446(-)